MIIFNSVGKAIIFLYIIFFSCFSYPQSTSSSFLDHIFSSEFTHTGVEDIISFHRIRNSIESGNFSEAVSRIEKFQVNFTNSLFLQFIPDISSLLSYHIHGHDEYIRSLRSSASGVYVFKELYRSGMRSEAFALGIALINIFPQRAALTEIIIPLDQISRQDNKVPLTEYLTEYADSQPHAGKAALFFNLAWIYYKAHYFHEACEFLKRFREKKISSAAHTETIRLAWYYLAACAYKTGNFREAEKKFKIFFNGTMPFTRDRESIEYWAVYYYFHSLLRQKKFSAAFAVLKKSETDLDDDLYKLYLRAAKGTSAAYFAEIRSNYLARFPYTYSAYLLQKEEAFVNLTQKNYSNGFTALRAAYRSRPGDLRFMESFLFNTNAELVLRRNNNAYYDYFYFLSNVHGAGKSAEYFSQISEHAHSILTMDSVLFAQDAIGEGLLFTNAVKPFLQHNDKIKIRITSQRDKFFSNYFCGSEDAGPAVPDPVFDYRVRFLSILGWSSIAEKEIHMRYEENEYKKFTSLVNLYRTSGEEYKVFRETIRTAQRRAGLIGFLPHSFLRECYPARQLSWFGVLEYYCRLYDVPVLFALSVIRAESVYNPRAVSPAGARGLMQIMDNTAREIFTKSKQNKYYEYDLFDPELNISLGVRHLGGLIKAMNGDFILAAAGYNAGLGNVRKWTEQLGSDSFYLSLFIPFDETERYVQKVFGNYFYYRVLYPELEKL